MLEVLQVRWLVQVLPEPESQQRTNRQKNGKIPLPAWEAVLVLLVGAVMDTKNKVRDSASSLKENAGKTDGADTGWLCRPFCQTESKG